MDFIANSEPELLRIEEELMSLTDFKSLNNTYLGGDPNEI